METDELISLGRRKLIQLATDKIEKKYPEFESNNCNIKVMAGDNRVIVEFTVKLIYLPQRSGFISGVTFDITEDTVSFSTAENHEDETSLSVRSFPKQTEESEKAIAYIEDKLKKKLIEYSIQQTLIFDKGEYYELKIGNGGFNVGKNIGNIYDEWHGHSIPVCGEDFREITE